MLEQNLTITYFLNEFLTYDCDVDHSDNEKDPDRLSIVGLQMAGVIRSCHDLYGAVDIVYLSAIVERKLYLTEYSLIDGGVGEKMRRIIMPRKADTAKRYSVCELIGYSITDVRLGVGCCPKLDSISTVSQLGYSIVNTRYSLVTVSGYRIYLEYDMRHHAGAVILRDTVNAQTLEKHNEKHATDEARLN